MYAQFGIYVVEGSILFIVSLLILVALIRTPKMAEKYSLIIAQVSKSNELCLIHKPFLR